MSIIRRQNGHLDVNLIKRREQRKKRRILYIKNASFRYYIPKLLKRFDPALGTDISDAVVDVIDSIVFDMFRQLAAEAQDLMLYAKRRTLKDWDIQFATVRCFRGELLQNAIEEGLKAVHVYDENMAKKRKLKNQIFEDFFYYE